MIEIDDSTEVKSSQLACVLGLSARRIQQLVEDGILSRSSRGKFKLCACVQRYCATN